MCGRGGVGVGSSAGQGWRFRAAVTGVRRRSRATLSVVDEVRGGAKCPDRLPRISHTWNAGRVEARGKLECEPRACWTTRSRIPRRAECSMLHAPCSRLHAPCSVFCTSYKMPYIHSTLGARPGSRKRPWPLDALNIRRDGCVSFHNGEAFLVPGRKAVRQRTGQDERPRACQGPNLDIQCVVSQRAVVRQEAEIWRSRSARFRCDGRR